MSTEKSLAIVIRRHDFSETSLISTLFTRDFGKISALAKGAKRPKGPFESALDLLSVCRVVFIHKSSDALDLLTEAKLQRRFRAGGRDLSRLYAGYYVAELLHELTDNADPHPDLFDTALETLEELDDSGSVAPLLLKFELTALRLLGHLPSLQQCAGCGIAVDSTKEIPFGQLAGGVLCPNCRIGQRQVVRVSGAALEMLKMFAAESRELPVIRSSAWGEVRGLLNKYLCNLLGKQPRLHAYLGGMWTGPQTSQEASDT